MRQERQDATSAKKKNSLFGALGVLASLALILFISALSASLRTLRLISRARFAREIFGFQIGELFCGLVVLVLKRFGLGGVAEDGFFAELLLQIGQEFFGFADFA